MDVRMLKPDANELCQVLWLDPDRQPPLVERLVVDIADANARHAQPVLVGIERADSLAKCLAHTIAAVWTHSHIHTDLPVARIEADRVIGRGKDDALGTGPVCRLEHVVAANDIGFMDGVPRALDRKSAEMDDA